MKIETKTIKIVNVNELQEALEYQGLPKDGFNIFNYLEYNRDFLEEKLPTNCYLPLQQASGPIQPATFPSSCSYNFILYCLKDFFGTANVFVYIP